METWLLRRDIEAVDWNRNEILAISHDYQSCKDLADKLQHTVEGKDYKSDICSVSFYITKAPKLISTPEEFDEIFEEYKGCCVDEEATDDV